MDGHLKNHDVQFHRSRNRKLDDLLSAIKTTFGLKGDLRLQYMDQDFGSDFFNLNSTTELQDLGTIKVIHQQTNPPLISDTQPWKSESRTSDRDRDKEQQKGRCRQNGSHVCLQTTSGGKPRTKHSGLQGQMACTLHQKRQVWNWSGQSLSASGFITVSFHELVLTWCGWDCITLKWMTEFTFLIST